MTTPDLAAAERYLRSLTLDSAKPGATIYVDTLRVVLAELDRLRGGRVWEGTVTGTGTLLRLLDTGTMFVGVHEMTAGLEGRRVRIAVQPTEEATKP